jgi:hypothetical protein
MRTLLRIILQTSLSATCYAQPGSNPHDLKLRHAEPLYADLVRDLGARKGEKEWNAGVMVAQNGQHISRTGFIEYECAPVRRLGIEAEVPVTFYSPASPGSDPATMPRNRVEGLKLASQYTFCVSAKYQLSMAAGYMHEWMLHSFYSIRNRNIFLKGNRISPFVAAARSWGSHMHSMISTGPVWICTQETHTVSFGYQTNMSVHYMPAAGRNFIGIELNHEYYARASGLTIRPQVKLAISDRLSVGIVTGIPADTQNGLSFLTRIIYEPAR